MNTSATPSPPNSQLDSSAQAYVGRFAPSPSGPLHFGSLITALASFLDAKKHHGQWLVRMEDIDPPREEVGAQQKILNSLEAHGLEWDNSVLYQSQRLAIYDDYLHHLNSHTYPCSCARARLRLLNGAYDGHCRRHQKPSSTAPTSPITPASVRVRVDHLSPSETNIAEYYDDIFQGKQHQSLPHEVGDFIVRRKDGLVAYQLAVVADDIEQKVTHIIRGSDLLSSTPRQRYLTLLLSHVLAQPSHSLCHYGHIPVATNALGQKLSKQHKALPIDDKHAFSNLVNALTFLHHPAPHDIINNHSISSLLSWASEHWNRQRVPQALSFVVEDT